MNYSLNNKPQEEMTATPTKYPQGYFKEKPCKWCSLTFKPKAPSHMYCSQSCADEALTNKYLLRNYKISKQDYKKMLDIQNNLCAICYKEGFLMDPSHKVKLVVDHCHSSGKVRGLLCHNCNRALGLLQDDILAVERALMYLKRATTIENTSKDGSE